VGLGGAARPARALGPRRGGASAGGGVAALGKVARVLAESEDQPHLIEALHAVSARLGGLPRRWRFDRMATVASPNTGRVTATFAAVAKHYGVHVDLCPPRHGNRKGTVEKANHSAAQRWWRTLADDTTAAQAQVLLDGFCARIGDRRVRRRDGAPTTVGALADAEVLAPAAGGVPGHGGRRADRDRAGAGRVPR
jgi:hypothetical protein